MLQRRIQITIPLPQPPQVGSVGRELSISCDGGPAIFADVPLSDTQHIIVVPRNAKVHVELADLDAAGNRGLPSVLDFVAVTAQQLGPPGALSAPTATELPSVTRVGSLPASSPSGSFVIPPGTAP